MLNDFFKNCFNPGVPPLHESTLVSDSVVIGESLPEELLSDEDEIAGLLLHLDPNKTNGVDGIAARMLRATAASIAKPLNKLFNLFLHNGQFPSAWKNSCVIPIPKNNEKTTV